MNSTETILQATLTEQGRKAIGPKRGVKSFASLSERVNTLRDDYDIMRESIEGLLTILDAQAGLMMISGPSTLMYSKHAHQSDPLADFERTLKVQSDKVLSLFALEPNVRMHHADGLLLIPLRWQLTIVGLLALDDKDRNLATASEIGLVPLCNQLAAIFGQRYHPPQHLRQRSIDLKNDEVEQLVAIQHSLLPTIPSPSHGLSISTHTQAAGFVGGDYFDLIVVDGDKMGIVIADVEGKGVPAALFGNMLRTTVHFLTRESPSTAAVVGKINSILHKEASSAHKLFTLFYAVYDAKTKVLTYTGSGHVSPIVIRSVTRKVERLHSEGVPVGIEPRQRFHERSVQLQSNDLVAFFTDGLIECTNASGDMFGDDQLALQLAQHAGEPTDTILTHVLADVEQYIAGPPIDDRTLILTKVV